MVLHRSLARRPPRLGAFLGNAVVSLLTTAFEAIVYAALVYGAGAHYVAAAVLGGFLGIALNFLLNRVLVFRARGRLSTELVRYGAATVAGITLGAAVLHATVEWLGLGELAGFAFTNVFVFVAWTYPSNRRYVFRAPANAGGVPR